MVELIPPEMRERWRLIVLVFVVQLGIYGVVSSTPMSAASQATYGSVVQQIQNDTPSDFLGIFSLIFSNNLEIMMAETVPVVGPLIFGVSAYNTGMVFGVLSILHHVPPLALIGATLLFPHGMLETLAYAIALVEGLYLLLSIPRRRVMEEARTALYMIPIAGLFLFSAACLEAGEIVLDSAGVNGLVLWIPVVLAGLVISRVARAYIPS